MAVGLLKIGKRIKVQTTLGEDLPALYNFSSSLDTNVYDDITSNYNWMTLGLSHYDYLFCRNQIMMWTSVNGFSGMTQLEKEIAASNFVVGKSDRDTIFSNTEEQSNWKTFIESSQNARERRWKAAKAYISYVLAPSDGLDIAITTNKLSGEYITYGIEDVASDGVDGLLDWIGNTGSYTETGFSSKSYWTQEAQDNMLTILKDGIYTL